MVDENEIAVPSFPQTIEDREAFKIWSLIIDVVVDHVRQTKGTHNDKSRTFIFHIDISVYLGKTQSSGRGKPVTQNHDDNCETVAIHVHPAAF